jgi:hypothetical protein
MTDNTPNTEEQIKLSAQWKRELDGLYDTTIDIHTTLLEQVQALKNVRDESKNIYKLQDELNKLIQKGVDLNNKKADLESELSQNAQQELDIINQGLNARRDQGELIGKLAKQYNIIKDLEETELNLQRTGGQLTQEQQNKLNDARQRKLRLDQQILDTRAKEEALSNLLEAGAIDQLNHLSEAEKSQLRKYLNVVKENEEYEIYLKNHDINIKAQHDLIEQQKAQLTGFQKTVQYYNYITDKVKEIIKNSKALTFIQTQLTNVVGKLGLNFNTILDNVLKLDKVLTDFGKSVQVSKEGARALADSFQSVSFRASEINSNVTATMASIKNQVEANNELNKSLGTGALFTEKSRLDQIELTKGMGLEAETAAKLYQLGSLNQKTAHETAVGVGDQVVNFRKATGITLDYRKVLADVSKISGQLAVQYKNNPDLIAQAVIKTKELGMTLEQANNASKQLLNFTTSIESELEAELLTGKAINLEQARYYALMGDSASAAKELMNNVGGLGEFQKLNVLQQQSLAKAIGMGVDELSDTLVQQELLKGTAFQTKVAFEEVAREAARTGDYTKLNAELAQAANGEQLAAQAAQISNQEKFQMAIEKLQETIANMVNGPFGLLIDKFTTLVSKAWVLKGIVAAITTAFAINMVKGLVDVGAGLAKLIKPLATIAKLETLSAAMKSFGLGVVIAGAAALAGYAAINALASDGGGDGGANPSISGGGGVNVPMGGGSPQQQQQININNQFTLNNRDLGYISTQQDGVGTRRMA